MLRQTREIFLLVKLLFPKALEAVSVKGYKYFWNTNWCARIFWHKTITEVNFIWKQHVILLVVLYFVVPHLFLNCSSCVTHIYNCTAPYPLLTLKWPKNRVLRTEGYIPGICKGSYVVGRNSWWQELLKRVLYSEFSKKVVEEQWS